jgi:hypothetical protein
MHRGVLVAATVIATMGMGCSALGVARVHYEGAMTTSGGCTNSAALPVVDSVLASLAAIRTAFVFQSTDVA